MKRRLKALMVAVVISSGMANIYGMQNDMNSESLSKRLYRVTSLHEPKTLVSSIVFGCLSACGVQQITKNIPDIELNNEFTIVTNRLATMTMAYPSREACSKIAQIARLPFYISYGLTAVWLWMSSRSGEVCEPYVC